MIRYIFSLILACHTIVVCAQSGTAVNTQVSESLFEVSGKNDIKLLKVDNASSREILTILPTGKIGLNQTLPTTNLNIVKLPNFPTLKIEGIDEMTSIDGYLLGLDQNNNVVKTTGTPSYALFAQSTAVQSYKRASTDIATVTFANENIIFNNVAVFEPTSNTFKINEEGFYEVSGYITVNPQNRMDNYNANHLIVVNLIIYQYMGTIASSPVISSQRQIYSSGNLDVAATIKTPPITVFLPKDARILVAFQRDPISTLEFGAKLDGKDLDNYINKATGMTATKALRIIKK